jgi:hypothetical protein
MKKNPILPTGFSYNGAFGRQDRRLDPFQRSSAALYEEAVIVPTAGNFAAQIAANMNNNAGIVDVSNGKIVNYTPKPTSLSVTVESDNEAGAATAEINIFNNNRYVALDTDNGSGAGSIDYTWGDNNSGKTYENLFSSLNGGQGIGIRGFTLQVTTRSTNDTNGSLFNTMNMNIMAVNGQGKLMPFNTDLAEAIRNSQYVAGTLTVKFPFVMNAFMQINYQQAKNTTFAWTFITEYSSNLR